MEIILNQMNAEQIERYENILLELTQAICQESENLENTINTFPKRYDKSIDLWVKVLNRSKILHPKHTDISENFGKILEEVLPCMDDCIAEIMLPVFFIAAILNNEYNHNTVIQRAIRGNANWGSTKNLLAGFMPSIPHKQPQEQRFHQICADFEEAYEKYKNAHPNHRSTLLQYAEDIESLKYCYRELLEVQHNANIALFVLNILEAEHSSEKPMLMLIRMYVIDKFSGLISFSEDMSNDFPIASTAKGGLVNRYYQNGGPNTDRQISKHGLGFIRASKKLKRIDTAKDSIELIDDDQLIKLVNSPFLRLLGDMMHLIPISETDILNIKDYYLDRPKLEWYSEFYTNTIEYIKSVTAALNNKAHFDPSECMICDIIPKFILKTAYAAAERQSDR